MASNNDALEQMLDRYHQLSKDFHEAHEQSKKRANYSAVEEDVNPAKKIKMDFQSVIRVEVGDEYRNIPRQTFTVHKNLIASRSKRLARQIAARSDPEDDKPYHLDFNDPATFSMYLQLLYTGCVTLPEGLSSYDKWDTVLSVAGMAQIVDDPISETLAFEETRRLMKSDPPTLEIVDLVYNECGPAWESDESKMVVEYFAEKMAGLGGGDGAGHFFEDLVAEMAKRKASETSE